MPLPQLPDGYYVLSKDVSNPDVDRRRSDSYGKDTWKKGMRFKLSSYAPSDDENRKVQTLSTFRGTLRITVVEHNREYNPKEYALLENVLGALEPAPKTLGQVIDTYGVAGETLLAQLVESGKLTMDTVEEAARAIHEVDEDAWDALNKRNWT